MNFMSFILIITVTFVMSGTGTTAQTGDPYTKNVAVIGRDTFGKGTSSDVGGFKIGDDHYALATTAGGLSVVLVDAIAPSYYEEVAHVNDPQWSPQSLQKNISAKDVETFVVNNITYAAIGTEAYGDLWIIDVNQAILKGPSAPNHFVPITDQDVFVWYTHFNNQTHTITVKNNILYIATQTKDIDIWDLSNPYSPVHKGSYPTGLSDGNVHEMYVDPTGGDQGQPRAYVAHGRGGLLVVDINVSSPANSTQKKNQFYNSDKRDALNINAQLPWSLCHSAWPSDDRLYVFTTDEYSHYGNSDDYLRAPILKVWKYNELETANALKGNYFVPNGSENPLINADVIPHQNPPNNPEDIPSSIHQLHTRDGFAYIAHYAEGFRVLNISNPEQLTEVGYFDSFAPSTTSNYSAYWGGVFGVYPDEYRAKICYAGGEDGLYIFKLFHESIAGEIHSIERVNIDGTFSIASDVTITAGTVVNFNNNTTFNFTNNPTIFVDGQLLLNQNTFSGNMTIVVHDGGEVILCPNADIALASGQHIIIEDGGSMHVQSTAVLTLNGGSITCEGTGSQITVEDSRGIRGSGTIVGGRIEWMRGFDIRENQTLIFQNGGVFTFDCAQANRPQYLINSGNMEFQGSANQYIFGECLDEIRNYDYGTFVTEPGTTLQHLPTTISWNSAQMQSNGTHAQPCAWLLRQGAMIEDYTSLVATHTTFGGSTLQGTPPEEWDGTLVGDVFSWIDLDYCTVQDVYVDPMWSGSAIHFYQSGRSLQSRIRNSRIIRNTNGQNKHGDGVFLQPGTSSSHVKLECSEIHDDWYTGFTSVGSYPDIHDSRIRNNLVGVGLSVASFVDMKGSCVEGHVFEGIDIDDSELSFTLQGTAGGNRIVDNANQQLDVNSNSVVYGGWDPAGGSSLEGHDNNISSSSSAWVANGDGTGTAWLQKNWFGVTPGIYDPQTGLCYLTPAQKSQLFSGVTVYSDPTHCSEILPNCTTECPEWFQNPGGGVASFSKASSLPPFATSLGQLRAYARTGNFAEVYRFIGTLLPNTISAPLAKRYTTFLLHLENEHVRDNPDTLAISRSRLNAFLLNRFSASNQSATKAALLNVLARSLFAFEDIQGADYRIGQLRNQYPNSASATDILPVLQLVAMAQRDSVKMKNAIALMQAANFPASEMRIARTMKRAYHRFRPQSPYPKSVVYDNEQYAMPASPVLDVKNYPNPFNPSTVIEYTLPHAGHVALRVYNLLGREIAMLVNEEQTAGVHFVVFDGGLASSGMYIYVLTTQSGQATGRMVLNR